MPLAYCLDLGALGWKRAYRRANVLLHAGYPVRWAMTSFSAGARTYPRGTFVVPVGGDTLSTSALDEDGRTGPVEVDAPTLPLGVPRVAIYGGGGAPSSYARILASLGFLVDFMQPEDVRSGGLDDVDVFMMPGGGLQAMKGQLDPLGEEGCRAIDRWVRAGGMYIGSCAGAFDAAIVSPSFISACPAQRCMRLINARVWNSLDTEWIGLASPGVGVLQGRVLRPEHPVMFHLPPTFEIVHYNGPLFEPASGAVEGASEAVSLAAVAGVEGRFTPAEYFLTFSAYPGRAPADTLIARAAAEGVRTVIAGSLEDGRVVLFGSHPEFGTNLTMDGVGDQAVMLTNAVFWQSSARPRRSIGPARSPMPQRDGVASMAMSAADRIGALSGELRRRSLDPLPSWLEERSAMSIFALPAREIWEETLADFPRLLGALGEELRRFTSAAARTEGSRTTAAVSAAAGMLARHVPEAGRDFGFEGLPQAMARCEVMLRAARDGWAFDPPDSANPYASFGSSPYHQAVGSYLAASGVLAGAVGLVSAAADTVEVQREAEGIRSRGPAAKR